jgi:hypothetical protein
MQLMRNFHGWVTSQVPPIKVSDVSFGYPGMKKPLFTHAGAYVTFSSDSDWP